ncbi:hypothetical protein ABGB18_11290 [Nonomuraea sp. B12E4]
MTAVRRLLRHYVLRKPHSPCHAKPAPPPPPADDFIPFNDLETR